MPSFFCVMGPSRCSNGRRQVVLFVRSKLRMVCSPCFHARMKAFFVSWASSVRGPIWGIFRFRALFWWINCEFLIKFAAWNVRSTQRKHKKGGSS